MIIYASNTIVMRRGREDVKPAGAQNRRRHSRPSTLRAVQQTVREVQLIKKIQTTIYLRTRN